ncbi:hypothetical protein ACFQ6C_26035 [Streptomyces sp. NPDC056454]|uniref:hypothetical protein n=1 Tax=Streptomyces sp. NPDC056454 TaxID=3345823 RepID=UPI00369CE631
MKISLGWRRTRKAQWAGALEDLVLPAGPRTPGVLLHEYVRQVRKNRLVLTRDPMIATPGGPSGAWVASQGVDLVWVHPAAGGVQFGHVIGHELGHMINGDEPDPVDLTTLTRMLQSVFVNVSPGLLGRSLGLCRTDFGEDREQRAEEFAYFAEEWLGRSPQGGGDLFTNLKNSLETRRPW